jgi:hypothetical protein
VRTVLLFSLLAAACSASTAAPPAGDGVSHPLVPIDGGGAVVGPGGSSGGVAASHPADGGAGGDGEGSSGGDGDAVGDGSAVGTATDAVADAEAAGPCDSLTQQSLDVSEYQTIFAPPAPAGGPIAPGLYVLDEVTTYAPSDASASEGPPDFPTGALVRITIDVTATSMRFVEGRGTDDGDGGVFPPDTQRGEAYTASGTNLAFTEICPNAGQTSTTPYTASANSLTIFVSDATYERFRLVL